jgi:hypothetical protein
MNPDALAVALAGFGGVDESYLVDNQIYTDPLFGSIMKEPGLPVEGPSFDYFQTGNTSPDDPLSVLLSLTRVGDSSAVEQGIEQSNIPLALMGLLGLAGTIKPIGRAAAEYLPEAVKLAQKRVVEPIVKAATDDAATITISNMAREMAAGQVLDMSQAARIQRAAEQGYDTSKVWYHGTPKGGFDEFDPYGTSDYGLFGDGVYFTSDPEIASGYANKAVRGMSRPTIYPVHLKVENPMNMESAPNLKAWKSALPKEYEDIANQGSTNEDVYRALEEMLMSEEYTKADARELIQGVLRDMGHDGIIHKGGRTAGSRSHDVAIAFDPEQIRSISAAFDPAKKDSTDLLASILPPSLISTMALSSLMEEEPE